MVSAAIVYDRNLTAGACCTLPAASKSGLKSLTLHRLLGSTQKELLF